MWNLVKRVWEWIKGADDVSSIIDLTNSHQALQNACDAYAANPSDANRQAVDSAARDYKQDIMDAAVPIPFVGAPSGLLEQQQQQIDRWRELDRIIDDAFNRTTPKYDQWVQQNCNDRVRPPKWHDQFRAAEKIPPGTGSPIILDLDGDGIETMAVGTGAYFDHNADGFAESTGWVGPDDGLLVLDRDGNGRIDSGRELFGNETILANGQQAANGFEALMELDTNADGLINDQDAVWANLKVWRDLDGDGYSASNELLSLSDAGVASISIGYANSNLVDPAGNEHRQVGSFSRTDGTIGAATDAT